MNTADSWEFQSVPIDFEVFKALTARLRSPDDSYNAVLRRLLGLPESAPVGDSLTASGAGQPWEVGGVVFPHGTEFRAPFKGKIYRACVDDGALVYDGKRFNAPSPAAIAVTGNSVNGWTFWECRRPHHPDWVRIDYLRSKARPGRGV